MHRVLQPFEFLEPTTVREVAELVDGHKARVLAGGLDLVLKMRLRQIVPEKVVSLHKVPGLDHVEKSGSVLRLGALTTLRRIERSEIVRENWPLLAEAVGSIASVQIKVMGTAVGNLCVGTPASDVAPALYALGARVQITGADSTREIPAEKFLVDVGRTALRPHEIVTEILVPPLPARTGSAFVKLSKTAEDIAKVNVAVVLTMSGDTCTDAFIALGAVGPTPFRSTQAEGLIRGRSLDERVMQQAATIAAAEATPISDVRSTAEYRGEMVRVLVKDALGKAAARALA